MWHLLKQLKINWDDVLKEMSRTGTINRYDPEKDWGTQPIRVHHKMIGIMFPSTNPEFPNELLELIKAGKLNPDQSVKALEPNHRCVSIPFFFLSGNDVVR